MRITKFVHSCLLFEIDGKNFLIDPGNYMTEQDFPLDTLQTLDALLITHEHPDHMDISWIQKIVAKFPEMKIITNPSAKNVLEKAGISPTSEETEDVTMTAASHEKIFFGNPPENVLFTVANLLTHPGDSFQISSTAKILALPVQAPWGSLTQAVDLALSLKPEIIVPIHDWHWNDTARKAMFERLTEYFQKEGIRFLPLLPGESIDL